MGTESCNLVTPTEDQIETIYQRLSGAALEERASLIQMFDFENCSDQCIYDMLRYAFNDRRWDLISELLKNINFLRVANQNNLVINFAYLKQWDIVKELLVDLNALNYDSDNYVLQSACMAERYDIIEKLIQHPYVVPNLFVHENVVLRLAAERENLNIVSLLLTSFKLPSAGYTSLMVAFNLNYLRHVEITINLVSMHELNIRTEYGFSLIMLAAAKYSLPNTNEADRNQIKAIIRRLLNKKVDITTVNRNMFNFLRIAGHASLLDDKDIVDTLFDNYDTEDFKLLNDGKTLLHKILESRSKITPTVLTRCSDRINQLDNFGNSPLSYVLLTPMLNQPKDYLLTLVENGAKFIRCNREVRTPLHIAVLSVNDDDAGHDVITKMLCEIKTLKQIDHKDENGLTALHYAVISKKRKIEAALRRSGAKANIRDHLPGFTANDYLAMQTPKLRSNFSKKIFGSIWKSFNASISTSEPTITDLKTLLSILSSTNHCMQSKLHQLGWLKAICKTNHLDDYADFSNSCDNAAKVIIEQQSERFSGMQFPQGFAFGIELEIPELRSNTNISFADLTNWFGITIVHDVSVHRSLLSPDVPNSIEEKHPEINSPIIADATSYNKFLILCSLLKSLGARVNATAGFHLHINCRGIEGKLPALVPPELEFIYIRYLLANYCNLEMILRGYFRDGTTYDPLSSYSILVSELKDQIENCYSIKELQKLCTHNCSIDLTALNKHGTVEFRLHEGTVDPILIVAWVDIISRLVMCSVNQAKSHIFGSKIEACPNIENLAYLLLVQRKYDKTWDPATGSVKAADCHSAMPYPGLNKTPFQQQITKSIQYKFLKFMLYGGRAQFDDLMQTAKTSDDDIKVEFLEAKKLFQTALSNPGIFFQKPSTKNIRDRFTACKLITYATAKHKSL